MTRTAILAIALLCVSLHFINAIAAGLTAHPSEIGGRP